MIISLTVLYHSERSLRDSLEILLPETFDTELFLGTLAVSARVSTAVASNMFSYQIQLVCNRTCDKSVF